MTKNYQRNNKNYNIKNKLLVITTKSNKLQQQIGIIIMTLKSLNLLKMIFTH